LKDAQRAWMAGANKCADMGCLTIAYQNRLAQLHILGGSDSGSAASSPVVESQRQTAVPTESPVDNDSTVSAQDIATTNAAAESSKQTALQKSSPTQTSAASAAKNGTPIVATAPTVNSASESESPWVLWLLGIGAIAGGLLWGIFKTNEYCDRKYEYKPFNIIISGVMAIGFGLFIGSLFALPAKTLIYAVPFAGHTNFYILFMAGVISPIGCFVYLVKKTNPLIAAIASLAQLLLAPVALAALVILVLASGSKNNSARTSAGIATASAGGSKSYAPSTPSYGVQRLLKGQAQWTSSNYPKGTMSGAIQFADKLKEKEPTTAIRVVEIVGGKVGATIYSV